MKLHPAFVLLLAATQVWAEAFVHETAKELTSTADFNGDGIADAVIVDKSSGLYRIGYGTAADGPLDWAAARPLGLSQVAAVAVGTLGGSTASLIAGSSASNRVQAVSPTGIGYVEPRHVGWFRNPLGLAAIQMITTGDEANELAVVAGKESEGSLVVQLDPQGTEFDQIAVNPLNAGEVGQVNPVRYNRLVRPFMGYMSEYENQIEGGFETRAAFSLVAVFGTSSTNPQHLVDSSNMPPGTRYVAGNFDADETDLFFYTPGTNTIVSCRILETNSVLSLGLSTEFSTVHPIRQVVVLPGAPSRLAVLLDTGAVRVVNFNGTTQTWPVDPLISPAAGAAVNGLIALGSGRFLALSGSGLESTSVEEFKRGANGDWSSQGTTTLPKVNRHEIYANVLLMHDHPFRYDGVMADRSYRSRDWTTGAAITSGSIAAESAFFGNSNTGIGTSSSQTVGSTGDAWMVAVPNQLHTQFSMFSLSKEIGRVVNAGEVQPPSGTYSKGFRPAYDGPGSLHFRIAGSGGDFEEAGGENGLLMPWIERDTEIEYYVAHDYGYGFSPTKTVSYRFTAAPAQIDTDGDGAPDFVETESGTDPANADTDGDGFKDLDELSQGFDPLDSASKPQSRRSQTSLAVNVGATLLNLDGDIIDRAAEDTPAIVSTLDGHQLATAGIGSEEGAPFLAFMKVSGVSSAEHFLSVRTAESFTLRTGSPQDRRGREFLGLVPAMEPVAWSFDLDDEPDATTFIGGGTNWLWGSTNWSYANQEVSYFTSPGWAELQTHTAWGTTEDPGWAAADWLNAYNGAIAPRTPLVEITLSPDTTLHALLVEEILHHLLLEREAFSAARHFSVTPGRGSERTTKQANVTLDEIAALEHADAAHPAARVVRPRFVLTHVDQAMNSPNEPMEKLIKVARDVYRLGQQPAGSDPMQFVNPLDVLRAFIRTGALPADYAAALSVPPAGRAEAFAEIAALIAAVPVRTPQIFTLRTPQVISVLSGMSLLESTDGTTGFMPLDESHRMLRLGENRAQGTPVTLTAYLDMPSIGGFQSLEVISASFDTTPPVVAEDSDGDLLADTWEMAHFGTLSHNGASKPVGGAYTLAQEYFEGTDPADIGDHPAGSPVELKLDK
ncbi:MAG: hypothetical protein JNG86_15240, partial [Verrucomicrobiaceae bacterium]|nr:hypothetical protein [Verrucomicrobiaceae bacterium]